MKNLCIYDPEPYKHDYISHKFFVPLLQYGKDTNLPISKIDSLESVKNSGVLVFGGYLTPSLIKTLKENGNSIFSFDITDGTWLAETYRYDNEACQSIDRIFKFSGIPKVRYSNELQISDEIDYYKHTICYMEKDEDWEVFCKLRDNGTIVPMPHIAWHQFSVAPVSFNDKLRKCLEIGRAHV